MKQRGGAKLFALVFDHLKLRVEKIRLSLRQGDTDVFGAEGREAGSALFQPSLLLLLGRLNSVALGRPHAAALHFVNDIL